MLVNYKCIYSFPAKCVIYESSSVVVLYNNINFISISLSLIKKFQGIEAKLLKKTHYNEMETQCNELLWFMSESEKWKKAELLEAPKPLLLILIWLCVQPSYLNCHLCHAMQCFENKYTFKKMYFTLSQT